MDIHQNARLTPHGRAELVRRVLVGGQTPKVVATAFGVNVNTVRPGCARFEAEGSAGWPIACASRRPMPASSRSPRCAASAGTGDRIAKPVGVAPATVRRVLRRRGLSRLKDLAPARR